MSLPFLTSGITAGTKLNNTAFGGGGAGAVGGWIELGRTTLCSNADTIDVTCLPDKRYYMVLTRILDSGQTNVKYRFNSDTGASYAKRQVINGGAESTGSPQSNTEIVQCYADDDRFQVSYIANLAGKEKLWMNWAVERGDNLGAAYVPARIQTVAKWANTSNAISAVNVFNDRTGDFASGSEVVVLGWDPSDSHTTNFWEELASVELCSPGALSSGTFTARKYLWVQVYITGAASGSPDAYLEFNNDSATNYTYRTSGNGGSDLTAINDGYGIRVDRHGGTLPRFFNSFIINSSANAKLVISHLMNQNTAGAGTAPVRTDSAGKWVNTSNQITQINVINQSAINWNAGSIIKVWGAD